VGKAGMIVLGALIIGTVLGVFFSNTFSLSPIAGLPLLCALAGLVTSALLVSGYGLIRKRSAGPMAPAPSTPAPTTPLPSAPPSATAMPANPERSDDKGSEAAKP
jgi:hypothetical protein